MYRSCSGKGVKIYLSSSKMKFSAAHFTIFSQLERERLHGHNFKVFCSIYSNIGKNGMAFNYQYLKGLFADLCGLLDERLLLPEHSPYLQITQESNQVKCTFNHDSMVFPKEDVKILPLTNITIEELARWFLTSFKKRLPAPEINFHSIKISVSSSASQSGTVKWIRNGL